MNNRRLVLHEKLKAILGSENVYYQPPETVNIRYPAIVYSRSNIENTHANNKVYYQKTFYEVTVIGKQPDSETVNKISLLPFCRFNRHFVSDNLYHDVFTLYF